MKNLYLVHSKGVRGVSSPYVEYLYILAETRTQAKNIASDYVYIRYGHKPSSILILHAFYSGMAEDVFYAPEDKLILLAEARK